jgi:hypothetical protein
MKQKTTFLTFKRLPAFAVFLFLSLLSLKTSAQTTEAFEDDTIGGTTFSDNGQNFTIVNGAGESSYDIENYAGAGWNGTAADSQFIDNSNGTPGTNDGSSFSIKTTDGTDITIKSFYLFLSNRYPLGTPSTTLTITGKKNGASTPVYTITKSSGFSNSATFIPNNGYTFIDFATEGDADYSNFGVDEIIISTTNNADYLALDGLTWGLAPVDPTVPTVTYAPGTICDGNASLLSITGTLNDADHWAVYTGSCGGTLIGTTTTSTIIIVPTIGTATYYVRGEGGGVSSGACGTVTITTTTREDATFNYTAAAYCPDGPDPTPTITGVTGGTFFSSPAGLSINASTGVIDVSASTPNTYTVTYNTPGLCDGSETATITINALDDASFTYSAAAFCADDMDPTPTITGLAGGTFSAGPGLSINASTGVIDVSTATTGFAIMVTYTTAGSCPNSSNVLVTVNALDDASFSYSAAAFCADDTDPTPTITGVTGGTFSSSPAGLSINAATGEIDLSASLPSNYTVTYTTTGSCPNSSSVSVTVNALDDASFSYSAAAFCADDTDPTPTITGVTGGSFSAGAGLSINAGTGAVDVSASTPNTYTVTYTTAGSCPNSSSVSVTVNALDDASFSYSAAAFCVDGSDPTPTITGLAGGTFSAGAGLSINAGTGAVDVSASLPSTYTVTYTTIGTCPNSSSVSVIVNALDDASFSYSAAAFCVDDMDPTPTITGVTGGTFSAGAGLSINAGTGAVDVSASTPNTYTVTYTTAGSCPNSSSVSVTVNAVDDASFTYSAAAYNNDDTDPTPTVTGIAGGTFSSTGGLSINAATGEINLSTSLPSNYTVTYTTTGTCSNSSTFNVTINYSTYTWTGTTNNDWNTASNWDTNVVPHTLGDVIINSGVFNYPTTTSGITVKSLTINSGASFIAGSTVTGPVTYKRNIPDTNWHLVSSPLAGESFQDIIANHTFATGTTGGNIGLSFYSNNGATPWSYATLLSSGTASQGLGLSMKLAAPGELSITGTAISSLVPQFLTTGDRNNFNLLGNPYTSFMSSATFAFDNTSVLSEETIWLWNGSSYITYNAINPIEIEPGQGFFVEAAVAGFVNFAVGNQSHQTPPAPTRQEAVANFELSIENGNDTSATKVFYVNGKTTGFDNGYDSKMFGGAAYDFALFTELVTDNKGDKLAIQTLPNTDLETMVVPVGIIAEAGKEITFSINTTSFPSGTNVYLEDRLNNTFTNLSQKNYNITLDVASKGVGQFYIHTTSQSLNVQDLALENVSIYKTNNNTLRITGLQSDNASVKVFNMLGKQMMTKAFKTSGVKDILLPRLAAGVYLVQLQSDKGRLNKKIIIE